MAPATDEDALYHQLSQSRIKNIYRDSLRSVNHNYWYNNIMSFSVSIRIIISLSLCNYDRAIV